MHSKDFHQSHLPLRHREHLALAQDSGMLRRVESCGVLPPRRQPTPNVKGRALELSKQLTTSKSVPFMLRLNSAAGSSETSSNGLREGDEDELRRLVSRQRAGVEHDDCLVNPTRSNSAGTRRLSWRMRELSRSRHSPDDAEESCLTDPSRDAQHQKTMRALFSQHDSVMHLAQSSAEPRLYSRREKVEMAQRSAQVHVKDRVTLEREEMATRRRFVMQPRSMTY